jgi:hypothetical protein
VTFWAGFRDFVFIETATAILAAVVKPTFAVAIPTLLTVIGIFVFVKIPTHNSLR